jgi:polyisoprenoid-binding protein YceI
MLAPGLFALALATPVFAQSAPPVVVDPAHAAQGTVFYIADPMGRNAVTFKSQAPLEDIVGTSNALTGYVVFDPAQPSKGARGQLTVPVASLRTGIPMRDEHLHGSDWLDASAQPDIRFVIDNVKDVKVVKSAADGRSYDLKLGGSLSIHGQTRRIEVPARVTYLAETEQTRMRVPGNLVAGRTSFNVSLKDFGVRGMQGAVGPKVSDTITIDVSFFASDKQSTM